MPSRHPCKKGPTGGPCGDDAWCGACRAFRFDPEIRERWSGGTKPPPPAVPVKIPVSTVEEVCKYEVPEREGGLVSTCSRGEDFYVRKCRKYGQCSRLARGDSIKDCGTCHDYEKK